MVIRPRFASFSRRGASPRHAPRFPPARAGSFGQRVAQIGPRLFHLGFKVLHNLRMLLGNIGGFADVVGQVVSSSFSIWRCE